MHVKDGNVLARERYQANKCEDTDKEKAKTITDFQYVTKRRNLSQTLYLLQEKK